MRLPSGAIRSAPHLRHDDASGRIDAGTKFDYGQGSQYATTPLCGGPFGADSTYCDTVLTPTP